VFEYKSSKKRLKGTQSCLSDLDIGKAKRSRDVFSQIYGQDEPFPLIRPRESNIRDADPRPRGSGSTGNVLVLDNSVLIV
jgi:hypothetical protein